jgi:hypothetical protein
MNITTLRIDWIKLHSTRTTYIYKYCPACQEDPCMCSDPF